MINWIKVNNESNAVIKQLTRINYPESTDSFIVKCCEGVHKIKFRSLK